MSSSAIIDIQGYSGLNNQFIPREIAVFYSSNHIQHMFLKSSSSSVVVSEDLQWQSNWVYNNYRRFKWNGGGCTLQYKAINMLLNNLKEVNKVYVKGIIKSKWINNLLTGDCGAIDGIQAGLSRGGGGKGVNFPRARDFFAGPEILIVFFFNLNTHRFTLRE